MKRILSLSLFLSFLFFSSSISAQEKTPKKVNFSIYGAPTYTVPRSETQVAPFFNFISQDSTEIRFRNDERDVFFKYENKFGASLGLNVHADINKFIQLESGLGLQFFQYFGEREFGPSRPSVNADITTISLTTNPSGPNTTLTCDEFIDNSSEDIQDFRQGFTHNLLYLNIPIQINFRLYDGLFNIYTGALFSTPVFTDVPQLNSTFQRDQQTDDTGQTMTICTFETFVDRDRDGTRFRDNNFGVYGGVRYQLGKRWAVDLHYQQSLRPITVETFHQVEGAIRLSSFALKLRYFLSSN